MDMKWVVLAAGVLLPHHASAEQASPAGIWNRDDGNARVRIAPCGANICATNVWIRDTSKGEEVGDKLVMTVKPQSANVLSGKAYDPKRNLTYAITLKTGSNSLTTRGCVVGGLICKEVGWTPAR